MEDGGATLNLALTGSTAVDPIIPDPLIVDPCDFGMPYINFSNTGGGDEKIAETQYLTSYFTKLNNLIEEENTDIPEWYFLMKRAWHLLNNENENISSEDRAILEDLLENTAFNKQYEIFDAFNNLEPETAGELLLNFTPETDFDQNMFNVSSIYINAIDTSGKVSLSSQDSIDLLAIALQNAFEAGIAVHIARGLLDTIVNNPIEILENKLLVMNESVVYPNPAFNWLNLGDGLTNLSVTITLTNIMGQTVLTQQLHCIQDNPCGIYIGNLPIGCYTFGISKENELISMGKFLKF